MVPLPLPPLASDCATSMQACWWRRHAAQHTSAKRPPAAARHHHAYEQGYPPHPYNVASLSHTNDAAPYVTGSHYSPPPQ